MVCAMTTDWPPRVLSNLYRDGLQTFYDLLVGLISKSLQLSAEETCVEDGKSCDRQLRATELRKQAEKKLVGEGDPAEYLTLLNKSYAVMSETAPTLGHVSFEQRWTQEQIVERVIVLQFQQEEKPSHVLCAGYRKLRPSVGKSSQRRSPHGLECACENSSVEIVNSQSWKILLSRVGDLIMLHVLSHAAVFSPLLNNCFLQVSGVPSNRVVSVPGKSPSIHPGEEMLRTKRRSECYTTQYKAKGRPSYLSGVQDRGKQPDYYAEPQADATTSIADESKQACARKETEVAGVLRHQTSNCTRSPSLKRHRAESGETGMKMDGPEGYSKSYDLRVDNIDSKREKCGSRDQVDQNNVFLQNGMVDTSNDSLLEAARSSSQEIPAKRSRRAPEGNSLQYSVHNKGLLDDDEKPRPDQFGKRRKLAKQIEKEKCHQQGKKLRRIPDRASIESNAMVPQHLQGGNVYKKSSECSMQREGRGYEQETDLQHPSNRDLGDSPVVQDPSGSPSSVPSAVSSGKRVRLPSWKRRKLRQTQESRQELVYKDSALENCRGGQTGVAKQGNICLPQKAVANMDAVIPKHCKDESHLTALRSHQFQSANTTNFGCGLPYEEIAVENNFGSMTPKQKMKRKKSSHGLGTTDSIAERLIDRAPIFYNANYSCHPGLTAKHILNTAEPNEPGVARLFTAVFGAHCNISVCSFSRGHMYANSSGRKFKTGQSSQFKSVHELLRGLLIKSRRCAFARLLGRHCPLPEGFHSTRKDSPPVSAVLSQNPITEQKGSEVDEELVHNDEQQGLLSRGSASEVEEIMRIWLGPNYQSPDKPTAKHAETNSTSSSKMVEERMESSPIAQQTITSSAATAEQQKQDDALETPLNDNLGTEKIKEENLISCYTAHSKVVGFLWAVCRSIIPQEMLGCLRSWRALRSSIAHFVSLRRHEQFNVKHALFRLPLSSFSWLGFQHKEINSTSPQMPSGKVAEKERALQQRRLEQWLYWIFTSLVVPLIRAHFYVTENENFRQNVFYYRKPVWARIRSNGLRELMSKNYKKLSKQVVAKVLTSRVLGFSQIRLLPKRTGLRPIANLAASSHGTLKFSIRTRAEATLCQVFRNLSKELSSGDFYRSDKPVSFLSQSASRVMSDVSQCLAVDLYEASPSTDAEKSAVVAKSPSCSLSLGKRRRSLVFLKRSKKRVNFSFRSINSVLRDAYCCLKLEKESHPEDLGSSVFGYCDIHKRVLPFIMHLKQSLSGMPRLFMAVCDVTKAYDSIPQERLQEIVESFVQSTNYKVARYKRVTPTLASVRVSHGRACTLADEPTKFVDSVRDLTTKRSHCIFVDQAISTTITRDQVLAMLGEHVKQNIVQIGSHFYQQKVGIPQGSILSSLLCSLFYGHFDLHGLLPVVKSHSIENSCNVFDSNDVFHGSNGESAQCGPSLTSSIAEDAGLHNCAIEQLIELSLGVSEKGQDEFLGNKPHVSKEAKSGNGLLELEDSDMPSSCIRSCEETGSFESNCVLLRLIDDSLFISTSEGGAKIFVESMHRGSKEYGCEANERKTATSFCLQLGDKLLPRQVYKTEDGACFMRWSGILVNCFTLEFQADYTRYCGEHIRSSLTVKREKNQGLQLVLKMCQYMRPKCHALFFDPRINSPATIRLNAFQAFLLCAMKFHAYVCCLPHVTGINEPFLYKAIDCAIRYMYGLLRHKMASVGAEAVAYFPYKELEWLAFVAFYRVLNRKQARYQILLDMLQTQLQMPKYNELRGCSHLSSATNEKRSSMFKFIKY